MGLSTKEVSSDGLDWSQSLLQAQTLELPKPAPARRQQQQQNQQQQPEPLKCPRCDSTNTKFCYYNNYNKSQPRHFCRACKRHWTKGGTLRNVPVGGGRKNKRQKKPAASASASTSTSTGNSPSASAAVASTTNSNISNRLNNMAIQAQQQRQNLPVSLGEQRCVPEFLYQSLLRPPSALTHKNFLNSGNLDSRTFGSNNRISQGSSLPFPLDQNLQVPFSTSSPFNTNPFSASASLPPPNGYNYSEEFKTMEEPTITGILANPSSTSTQPWQIPATTTGMDTNTFWSWDEIDTFASTDLNLPWDDSETKP